jgi:hypothetical protein
MVKNKVLTFGLALAMVMVVGGGCAGSGATGASGSGSASSSTITITAPQSGSEISSPVQITGTSKTAGGTVYSRLKDTDGSVMNTSQVKVGEDGKFNFSAIYFLKPKGTDLKIEIFEKDASGKEMNLASVPVKFK